jgi:hypothetical protein
MMTKYANALFKWSAIAPKCLAIARSYRVR